jgi:hypothetical protein
MIKYSILLVLAGCGIIESDLEALDYHSTVAPIQYQPEYRVRVSEVATTCSTFTNIVFCTPNTGYLVQFNTCGEYIRPIPTQYHDVYCGGFHE